MPSDPALTTYGPDLPAWRRLARSFPAFHRYPDHTLTPGTLNAAYRMLPIPDRHVASFLLEVWNGNQRETYTDAAGRTRRRPYPPFPNVRSFQLREAVSTWDRSTLRAFTDWAAGNRRYAPDSADVRLQYYPPAELLNRPSPASETK